jgi:hypothetical protein
MFVQVITGQVGDRAGLEAALDRWEREVRPGANGFLGSTGGITEDGRFVTMARFESAETAKANSDRPEQDAWWSEMERCFDGPVTFQESTDVDVYRSGGSDVAGFVQVMQGRADQARLRELDRQAEALLPSFRPDLLGSLRAWNGPDEYTEVAYFTSEADARAGEAQTPPPEMLEVFAQWQEAMGEITYYDLPSPKLIS